MKKFTELFLEASKPNLKLSYTSIIAGEKNSVDIEITTDKVKFNFTGEAWKQDDHDNQKKMTDKVEITLDQWIETLSKPASKAKSISFSSSSHHRLGVIGGKYGEMYWKNDTLGGNFMIDVKITKDEFKKLIKEVNKAVKYQLKNK